MWIGLDEWVFFDINFIDLVILCYVDGLDSWEENKFVFVDLVDCKVVLVVFEMVLICMVIV